MGDVRSGIPDLAAIRNRRGLSLAEIAATMKIRVAYLEAIENGNFEKLPGGVYTRSYIRQYAEAIDFEETTILQALPLDPEQEQAPRAGWGRTPVLRILHFARLAFARLGTAPRRTG